jgi:hypothetical protein
VSDDIPVQPDEHDTDNGPLVVHIGTRAVHRAVQNIVKNELRVDAAQLKEEVKAVCLRQAEQVTQAAINEYLNGTGWSRQNLDHKVGKKLDAIIEQKLEKMVAERLDRVVERIVSQRIGRAIECVIKTGKFKIGYSFDKLEMDVTAEPPLEEETSL